MLRHIKRSAYLKRMLRPALPRCPAPCDFGTDQWTFPAPYVIRNLFSTDEKRYFVMAFSAGTVVLYVHGKGGSAAQVEHYRPLFAPAEVVGFDYRSATPWDAAEEFSAKAAALKSACEQTVLVAESIGAYFSLNAGISRFFDRAFFISPIVDLERLIMDMMLWAGVTEAELAAKKVVQTGFGEDLSWDYLQYVRNNRPAAWETPTQILYGDTDALQSIETITAFANRVHAGVTVMNGGEHWFHTPEQMRFLDDWICKNIP